MEVHYRDVLLGDWVQPHGQTMAGALVAGGQAPGAFYSWLLERARLIDPALLVCEQPAAGAD